MFTPEFVIDASGEFVLVANHNLESTEAAQLSIQYNQARLAFGLTQLPANLRKCRLVYDIRGQEVADAVLAQIRQVLGSSCTVEFKR